MSALLRVSLSVDYPNKAGALSGVEFEVGHRESLAVLGESGSGKSTLVLATLGLLGSAGARVEGRIEFDGRNLLGLPEREWRKLRGREIAFVPQSATASLNPALRLATQMSEAWTVHQPRRKPEWKTRTLELFERVSLPPTEEFLRRFPAQISVGQAQRVLIAMALLHRPRLLISDEPTSALDPGTRDEIRTLLKALSDEFGLANLLITHDVTSIAGLCSRAVVLSQGRVLREVSFSELPFRQAESLGRALKALYSESAGQVLLNLSSGLAREAEVEREAGVGIE